MTSDLAPKCPLIQVAIDETSPDRARALAEAAIAAGADWLEVGKPFIEFNGLRGAERLIAEYPDQYWLLDLMVMAGSRRYLEAAADIGARNVTVTALAPRHTIAEAAGQARELRLDLTVDLFNVSDIVASGTALAELEPAYLMVHFGVDQKRQQPAGTPITELARLSRQVSVPLSYATYDVSEACAALDAGAQVIVQGEPLLSASDPEAALGDFVARVRAHSSPANPNISPTTGENR